MRDFIWVRHELPWVDSGTANAAHEDGAEALRARLNSLRFELFELDGRRMTDAYSMQEEFGRVFHFDDFIEGWWHNWDAFHDCWRDVGSALPSRVAILWHHTDVVGGAMPKEFGLGVHFLLEEATTLSNNQTEPRQVLLFLLGTTREFPKPEATLRP